jgi:hypothetical protein
MASIWSLRLRALRCFKLGLLFWISASYEPPHGTEASNTECVQFCLILRVLDWLWSIIPGYTMLCPLHGLDVSSLVTTFEGQIPLPPQFVYSTSAVILVED